MEVRMANSAIGDMQENFTTHGNGISALEAFERFVVLDH
jgi:hypothetical protein